MIEFTVYIFTKNYNYIILSISIVFRMMWCCYCCKFTNLKKDKNNNTNLWFTFRQSHIHYCYN